MNQFEYFMPKKQDFSDLERKLDYIRQKQLRI